MMDVDGWISGTNRGPTQGLSAVLSGTQSIVCMLRICRKVTQNQREVLTASSVWKAPINNMVRLQNMSIPGYLSISMMPPDLKDTMLFTDIC